MVVSVGVWQVQYDLTDEYPEANDEFVKKEDYFRRVTPLLRNLQEMWC